MPFSKFPLMCLRRITMLPLLVGLSLAAIGEAARAATIGPGNVTAALGPTFFVDDAVTGGGDVTVTHTAGASYNRSFAGLLNANQGLSRVDLTGFGFATSTAAPPANNTAAALTVTFTYLGVDEAPGGGDDVVMGAATGTYAFTTFGEYVFAFNTPITANLNITGTRFLIQVAPANGSVLFKTAALTYETATGPKFSVAGIVAPQRVNLAKYQTVTTDSVSGQRLATYLTDGVVGNDNRWQSDTTGPHWARVTFPYPVEVGSAQLFSGANDGSAPTSFKLQYLNNTTWTDVPGASITGNTNVERIIVFTTPVTASSFRIYDSVDAAVHVKELALYPPNAGVAYPLGTDVTLNLSQLRPAVATSNTAGNFALLAVDGRVNKDSKWQTSTAGAQSLEIDLRVSTKIGSAHLYSGSPGVVPLAACVLRYWDGVALAWQDIPGGTVAANTAEDLVIPFTSTVTTTKVRLEFTNAGTNSVRELCIFPANTGNTGYSIGSGLIGAPPSTATFDDYNDAFYNITNPTASRFIAVSNGAPGLNSPGLTTTQGQYQVLLNVGAGTYRLRNRATGYCLSGAQLSTTPGAPLVDAPYSALPDQDWILDPIDSTNFLLVNQWSGLVIDTQGGGTAAGTALVQNANTGAASQRWQMVSSAKSPKKGIGGTSFATAFNINWAYNWGMKNTQSLPATAVYHPMQWGDYNWSIGTDGGPDWQNYPAWRTTSEALHHMGFNEPDTWSQSGRSLDPTNPATEALFNSTRSVTEAVLLWPRLQAMDQPLVAPCPANMTGGWLSSFYTQANSLGYRVDYTAKHSYPSPNGGSSDNLIDELQTGWTTWGKPMWLTEFSFVDWSGNSSWSQEDNYNCLAEFLWRAESVTWLRKYALFVFTEDAGYPEPAQPWSTPTPAPRSNSYDINGNMTAFGELYAAWDNDATVRTDKTYYIHNKGTRKRLADTLNSAPGGRSIRINDASVKWMLVATGTSNRYYVTSTRYGHRLSSDGTAVTQVAAGTTGTAVQWSLTEDQYGWFYLEHPATSKQLKLAYNNTTSVATFTMVANTNSEDASQWRFIVPPPPPTWTGATGTSWATAGNWNPSAVPSTGDAVIFDSSSTANLNTVLNQDFNLLGVNVTSPTGPVSIGGTNSLTVGASGIDLAGASQNLTITAPVVLSAAQNWSVATGRTLGVNGGVSGAFALNIGGAGTVSLGAALDPLTPVTVAAGSTLKMGASGVLGSGLTAVNPAVNGTLDLNGTSQSVNAMSGSGVVDNSTAGASILTVGNNDTAVTLNTLLQNTSGTLALVKTGGGVLTLPAASTFSGGFTNNGTGIVSPKDNAAFGNGPVVMNGSTIYSTFASYTYANALTLNGAILRVGGNNSHTVTWTGPVSVTANSGINADGGTAGITLSGGLNMNNGGHTLTSYANGTAHTVSAPISGTSGTIMVTLGTLNLNAANSFSGAFRSSAGGPLKIGDPLAMQNATLDMNATDAGTVNLNNLNATIGALTGSRNLALGSGTVSIGNNHLSTAYGGVLSGTGSLVKTGNGTLTLAGTNIYSGTTSVNAGTLALGAGNVLPSTAVSIGNATLDAATFTDTVGALDVTSAAKINLGTGAILAFANSSAIDWTGGALSITGTFVPGVSLRFGTTSGGLTATQLALISATGFTSFTLNGSGFLNANPVSADPYAAWSGNAAFDSDANGDGVSNGLAWLLGAVDKNANATGLLPIVSQSGGNLVLTFSCLNAASRGGAVLSVQHSGDLGITDPWTAVTVPETNGAVSGVSFSVSPGSPRNAVTATISSTEAASGKLFGRIKATP